MITFNGLPLYRVALGSQDGVVRVSLVDDPAVQSNFDVFRKQAGKAPVLYAVQDEDRHLVRGVVLRADWPIFRRDNPQDPGYYVTFSKDVIRQIAERYLADGFQNRVDTDHDQKEVDGVQMVQYFIKDTAAGISPEGFDDIADGSLFAEYHVTNQDVWDEIKAGTFKGFSVEIFYTLIPAADTMASQEDGAAEVATLFMKLFSKINSMTKLKEIRARLAKILAEFGSVTTDKGVIHWDGDEDLKEGDRVYVEDADGNRSAAEDGEYVTADNKTVVVVDGEVSEIRDPEAEVAPEDEPANEEAPAEMGRFSAVRAAFEDSYQDKEKAIVKAIYDAREGDETLWYLAEAGDDFAIIALWDEATYEEHYIRYAIAWNEDGTAVASDPTDMELAFVPAGDEPAAEETPTEEEFSAAVERAEQLQSEVNTLQARIAELEKKPAGKPVRESYRAKEGGSLLPETTGDRGLDRLARINRN